ncbi:uncharacterized protein LOC126835197 isoform X1 [Adelges cooleyi]|uniref:uncharacterized protein LOC126835197 isoform X1 n=1 Tax=Adelges cooleyi TaxID=133065 RepID=UPI00217F943C|nr:uncharacterized protein LOC126835197 isoform X1 [Adelges cooleyi]
MKIYSFLISFIFVNVSSTTTEMDYMKDVAITNAHIELALKTNNFTIKDKVVLNGLEHVIKKIIESRQYTLEEMNNMLVVPEYLAFCHDLGALREFQKGVRDKIQLELNIPVPEVPDEIDFSKLVLEELGAKRRKFTGIALKNMLNRIIRKPENVTNLINERRHLGTDTFENKIIRALAGPEKKLSLSCMCHLIALFMSTKSPESHIKHIQINPDDTCTLKDDNFDRENKTYKTYGQIEGQWCQVIGNEVQRLKELL